MEPYVAAEGGGGGGGRGGGPGTDTGLEESMWRLGLGGGEEEEAAAAAAAARLPERPGEADCVYYLRTGACGYGENCRYNHPRDRAAAAFNGGEKNMRSAEYPERPGQPVCEYYMKNGTCKFGSNCKYDHPREGSVQPVILNASGYPLRPGEKDCSHYMKTGHCKFGTTCKFHHPEIGGFVDTANMYPPVQPPPMSSSHPYPHLASWQMGRPPVLPGSFLSSSYPPMMLPSTVIPMQGWSPYISPVNQVASAGGHQTVQAGPLYGLSQQGPSSAVAYGSQFAPLSSSAVLSSSSKQEPAFPARPGQPECQYYLKTGSCKFGSACKYHHPQCLGAPKSNCMLSPLGLPLRPGSLPCAYYTQHGFCKFGPTCKFDHPMGTLSYSPSASSLTDVPIGPYPLGFTVAPMAPLSSSSDMRPDYLITKELLANQSAPPGSACVPAGAMVKAYASHMLIRPQTSAAGGIVTSHGREL